MSGSSTILPPTPESPTAAETFTTSQDSHESVDELSRRPKARSAINEIRYISATATIIAVILGLHAIYYAKAILMPIVAAVMLALLLRPVVRRFRRYRIADSVSAGITLLLVIGGFLVVFANLVGPATSWLNDAPQNLRSVGEKLHVIREQVDQLNDATEVVEDLAAGKGEDSHEAPVAQKPMGSDGFADGVGLSPDRNTSSVPWTLTPQPFLAEQREAIPVGTDEPIEVQVQQPRLLAGLHVLSFTSGVAAELFVMLILAYFMLASGDVLINNVLHILPSKKEKRSVVELVHNVERGISSYLLTVSVINLVLGISIAIAMWLLGLPNPLLWGAMATLFNFVPVVGALLGVIVILFVSLLTFDSFGFAIFPPFVYWCITTIEGNLITPHILGRSMSLNPIMVFLALSIWAWMWGIAGALLAVPILAVLKVSFDQFDRTRAFGTLLGDDGNR